MARAAGLKYLQTVKSDSIYEMRIYSIEKDDDPSRELICSYAISKHGQHSKLTYLDFCYLKSERFSKQWSSEFTRIIFTLKPNPPYLDQETIKTGNINLKFPIGFNLVGNQAERFYLVDSTGLVETEVFSESISEIKSSKLAEQIYNKAISDIMAQRGGFSLARQFKVKKSQCMIFGNQNKEITNYCYRIIRSKNSFTRALVICRFPREFIDAGGLALVQAGI